jgi:outer membrane protein OmpA-like peptidoglycan-associated protein
LSIQSATSIVGGLAVAAAVGSGIATAQDQSKTYKDARGRAVVFPLGDASFADEVVSFTVGTPPPRDPRWADPKTTVGPPDVEPRVVDPKSPKGVVLGCSGTLVVRFTDNVLVDVAGPDLYVFEVGPAIEPTRLAISQDGTTWTEVGAISGGTAAIDIAKVVKPGDRYRFVRLTDLKRACGGPFPGADIDAIGAIGSALRLSFDASVLFDFDRSALRSEALAALTDAAGRIASYADATVTVEGHTDNVGADAYNAKLSQARAESVRAFLLARPELKGRAIIATGFGATRPVTSNDSDAGRQQNRRVEIVVSPKS